MYLTSAAGGPKDHLLGIAEIRDGIGSVTGPGSAPVQFLDRRRGYVICIFCVAHALKPTMLKRLSHKAINLQQLRDT